MVRSADNLLTMEKLCTEGVKRKGISVTYQIFMEGNGMGKPPYISKREEELGTQVNGFEMRKIISLVFITSQDSNMIESSFKSLARWYITPDKAHSFNRRLCSAVGGAVENGEPCPTYGGRVLKLNNSVEK